jgi:hypothetical protein
MSIKTLLVSGLSLALFACAAVTAEAQSGPVGGPKQGGQPAAQAGKMNAERAAALLNSKVQMGQNGVKFVQAKVTIDGWNYDVIVVFRADGKTFDLITPLSSGKVNLTAAQQQGLQQKNTAMKADQRAFNIDQQDGRLYFDNWNFVTDNVSDQQFMGFVGQHCSIVRECYDLWKQS